MATYSTETPSNSTSSSETPSNSNICGEVDRRDHHTLRKHVTFFDRNNDGLIYPWETFQGLRAIGCGIFMSLLASIIMNVGFSWKTRPGKFPSLLFPIEIKNIKLARHGSDTGVYDAEGRFVHSKFEEIFKTHARKKGYALTLDELLRMLYENREPKDYGGWLAAHAEWGVFYFLFKDNNGLLLKETIQALYDGTLFEMVAQKKASAGKQDVTLVEKDIEKEDCQASSKA